MTRKIATFIGLYSHKILGQQSHLKTRTRYWNCCASKFAYHCLIGIAFKI